MRTIAHGYFLKEYGSWSVLTVAFLTGLVASREVSWLALPLSLALVLLINSKQAYPKWVRAHDWKGGTIFLGQIVLATAILIAVFRSDIARLLPLLVFPLAYLLLNRYKGEHFIITELMGFVLLSLAAVLVKFLITGGMDVRLFAATAAYFTAGVFKVRTLLLKKTTDRILTVLYVLFAALVYRGFHIQLVILIPLVDNIIAAATLYRVKLQITGWIEVVKSLLFLLLMYVYYY